MGTQENGKLQLKRTVKHQQKTNQWKKGHVKHISLSSCE